MRKEVNYEIVQVDEENQCMLINFTSEGREPIQVSARLPFEHETLESVVNAYSPEGIWYSRETKKANVQVGTTGTI